MHMMVMMMWMMTVSVSRRVTRQVCRPRPRTLYAPTHETVSEKMDVDESDVNVSVMLT